MRLFSIYRNVDVFGVLIQARALSFIAAISVLLMGGAFIVLRYEIKAREPAGRWIRLWGWIERKVEWISNGIQTRTTLVGMELYKILIGRRGLLLIGIVMAVLVYSNEYSPVYYSAKNEILNDFYEAHGGRIDEAAKDEIERMRAQVVRADKAYEDAKQAHEAGEISTDELDKVYLGRMMQQDLREVVAFLEKELSELEQVERDCGIPVFLVNGIGYRYLLGPESQKGQVWHGAMAGFLLVLLVGGLFEMEGKSGMKPLLFATRNGRKPLWEAKGRAALAIAALLDLLFSLYELSYVWIRYGLADWSAPVQCLPFLREFPVAIPIWGVLVLVVLLRFVIMSLVAGMIWLIGGWKVGRKWK